MKKLLVICGPTATGKTKLALHLSKLFNGELVSADSRQIYKGMDVGTGKDLPVNVKWQISNVKSEKKKLGFYTVSDVRIWGYDLVRPKEEFSVARYIKIGKRIIENIWKRKRLPILVGGTGFYIKGVVDGIPTAGVPKNIPLRESFAEKNVGELFEILAQVDAVKVASMNTSDRKNPRRLIRAIEVASSNQKAKSLKLKADILFVGLIAPKEALYRNIEKRVEERIKQGFEEEIVKLLSSGVSWRSQAMDSLGYKQWNENIKKLDVKSRWTTDDTKNFERNVAIDAWKRAEKQYARRQMTWFKKDKRITWFDSSKKNYVKDVEKVVEKWYKS